MPSKPKVRMAQYGTKHSHAPGVLAVTLANPDVEFAGVYEPDPAQRSALQTSGAAPWSQVAWLDDKAEILEDATIVAVSSEGSNAESLEHTEEIVAAGKHVFYDKPAGVDYPMFERIVGMARERGLLIQLGVYVPLPRRFRANRQLGALGVPRPRVRGPRPHVDVAGPLFVAVERRP